MPWDSDFDLSAVGGDAETLAFRLKNELKKRKIRHKVKCSPEEQMVQLLCNFTHADIFIWKTEGNMLVNRQSTNRQSYRKIDEVRFYFAILILKHLLCQIEVFAFSEHP